ncbi:MAG: hypothetical protein H7X93_02375 [Sphingomonadaceae bacterium]|nr:hypothetical protein [Sphingomonadaceae bacterium]
MTANDSYTLWDIFNAGWFSVLMGSLIGILGITLAIIFHFRARQIARLYYLVGDNLLIWPKEDRHDDGLEIRCDGIVVPRVTSTSFGIWNSGTTTIQGQSIVDSDRLRLVLTKGGQILRATITSFTRDVNGCSIKIVDGDACELHFDFLDPGDGFSVQIVHSSSMKSLEPIGTIMGLPQSVMPFKLNPIGRFFDFVIFAVPVLFGLLFLGTSIYLSLSLAFPWKLIPMLVLFISIAGPIVMLVYTPDATTPPKIRGVPTEIAADPVLRGFR